MDEEADRIRRDVQEHLSAVVVSEIEIGEIGGDPTADTDVDFVIILLSLLMSPLWIPRKSPAYCGW